MSFLDSIMIMPFDESLQEAVRELAREVLCGEFGLADLSAEDDLEQIARSYAPPGGWFFVAFFTGRVVGIAGVQRLSDSDCELRRLLVLAEYRRQGLAAELGSRALQFVRDQGYGRMLVEVRPEMPEAFERHERFGLIEDTQDLPRPGSFVSLRL